MKKETNTYSSLGIPVSFVYSHEDGGMSITATETPKDELISQELYRLTGEVRKVNQTLETIAILILIVIAAFVWFQIF